MVGAVLLVLMVELLNSALEAAVDRISLSTTFSSSAPRTWAARRNARARQRRGRVDAGSAGLSRVA